MVCLVKYTVEVLTIADLELGSALLNTNNAVGKAVSASASLIPKHSLYIAPFGFRISVSRESEIFFVLLV